MLQTTAARIARLQLLIAGGVSAAWGLGAGVYAAVGAALGGLIGVVLTIYVAARLLSRPTEGDPHAALGAMVRAEIGKFVLASVLVTLAVLALPQQAAAIATTLAATLSAYWFALLRIND